MLAIVSSGDMISMKRYEGDVNTSSSGMGDFGYHNVRYANTPCCNQDAKFGDCLKPQLFLACGNHAPVSNWA